jgi:hypothetical protein
MRKIVLGLLFLYSLQIYAQQGKDITFTQKVFYSDFSDSDKIIWPLKNNQYYLLLIQKSKYHIECSNTEKKAYLLPKAGPKLAEFKVEANMVVDKNKDNSGSVGLVVDATDKLDGGYIVEINDKKEFRVRNIETNGNLTIISGEKKEGWKGFKGKSDNIRLAVTQDGGNAKVIINGLNVFSFTSKYKQPGQNGLFITGQMKADVGDFTVYAKADADVSTLNNGGADNSGSQGSSSKDVATVTASLLECRKQSKNLSARNDALQEQLTQSKKKQDELQKFINENLDVKLQKESERLRKENDTLSKAYKSLKQENSELKDFKAQVVKAKDGDLIDVLGKNLEKEKQANAELQKKIDQLTKENKALRAKSKK